MRQISVVSEPELEGDAVVLRVVIEDPAQDDTGGIFICRLKGFGNVAVERFPRDQAPPADGALRAAAAIAAMEHAVSNSETFQRLFAVLEEQRSTR